MVVLAQQLLGVHAYSAKAMKYQQTTLPQNKDLQRWLQTSNERYKYARNMHNGNTESKSNTAIAMGHSSCFVNCFCELFMNPTGFISGSTLRLEMHSLMHSAASLSSQTKGAGSYKIEASNIIRMGLRCHGFAVMSTTFYLWRDDGHICFHHMRCS